MEKNAVIQFLEDKKIEFVIRSYPIELRDTTLVAKFIGVPENRLFKSLVVVRDGKPVLVMLPSNRHLDLEKLKVELGAGKIAFASKEQAKKLTGMEVGGISPLGLLGKNIPVYIDQTVLEYDWIVFSAGQRGMTVQMAVSDVLVVIKPQILTNA